jgi:hypothetical protein
MLCYFWDFLCELIEMMTRKRRKQKEMTLLVIINAIYTYKKGDYKKVRTYVHF